MHEALRRALEVVDAPGVVGIDPLAQMRAKRNTMNDAIKAILALPTAEKRDLRASEDRDFCIATAKSEAINERVLELEAAQTRTANANATHALGGPVNTGLQGGYVNDAPTYQRGRPDTPSYFRDLVACRLDGDSRAAERLTRNNREARALGNTGAVGGSAGEFAPPAWLLEEFVKLARPGRVTADRTTRMPLPSGVSTINVPKVSTGTTAAIQTTQNTAVSQTDMTTTSLSSGIVTVAGKQVVSRQLIDQSGVDLDMIILGDLAADAAKQVDLQVLSGTGAGGQVTGILNVAGITQVAYTQATPSVSGAGGLYSTINKAISAIATARYAPPDCILMHPRRWSWTAAAFDAQNRPLVSPSGNAFNAIADAGEVAAQGPVGQMAGLPVYLDANIPTNLGAGANQDPVIVARFADLYLWESVMEMATFEQAYADSMGVLFRAHEYLSFQGARYPASIAIVNGTGTVPPVY